MAALDLTDLSIAGRVCAVAGYGRVGEGVSRYARALGARVIVTEVDPFAALRAHHDGFEVRPLIDAVPLADVVFSATGVAHTISLEHLAAAKDGAVVAVAGGVDEEIALTGLAEAAAEVAEVRPGVTRYRLAETSVDVLADGDCVNCAAAEGNPIEIMDLSLAVQALAVEHLLIHGASLPPAVHPMPDELDERVARAKLAALEIGLDRPTARQREFLARGVT
jgi:adenosylhomocysteinase